MMQIAEAATHIPFGTEQSRIVEIEPTRIDAQRRDRNLKRVDAAMPTPSESIAPIMPAAPCMVPRMDVLSAWDRPALHQDLKKMGKKPAMTVVMKALFAQS